MGCASPRIKTFLGKKKASKVKEVSTCKTIRKE